MTAVATAPDVAVRPRPVSKTRRLRWQRIVSPVAILLVWEALSARAASTCPATRRGTRCGV
ncbi:hypothetical protein AB0C29_45655, partial [Actinoplanes sp. NPDC048791]|uniref:hypothetical protein n=1 Tax=Actinoplanes sp. NPDC048791 TaxID=3154623 RepID=UPI0033EEA89B